MPSPRFSSQPLERVRRREQRARERRPASTATQRAIAVHEPPRDGACAKRDTVAKTAAGQRSGGHRHVPAKLGWDDVDSRRISRVARQRIGKLVQRRFRGDEDVTPRPHARVAVEEPGGHVPEALVVGDGGDRRAAVVAKRPLECAGRAIVQYFLCTREPLESLPPDAEPRAEQRAVVLAAQRAMAVREPAVRRRNGERHRAAEARTARARAHAPLITRASSAAPIRRCRSTPRVRTSLAAMRPRAAAARA
jgi:hypothetical protein